MDIIINHLRPYRKHLNLNRYISQKELPYVLAASLMGCLNHFLYQLSGESALAALFCPVNESVWEHLKLLFFPILFVSVIEYIKCRPPVAPFFYRRFLAVVSAMALTVALFYTYTGIIGRNFLFMDILIFLLSVLSVFYMDGQFFCRQGKNVSLSTVFSLWIGVSLCFFAFTCFPPDIPLFFSASI